MRGVIDGRCNARPLSDLIRWRPERDMHNGTRLAQLTHAFARPWLGSGNSTRGSERLDPRWTYGRGGLEEGTPVSAVEDGDDLRWGRCRPSGGVARFQAVPSPRGAWEHHHSTTTSGKKERLKRLRSVAS